jgi:hypothetical protein
MVDLFRVPWAKLDLQDVEAFLADAQDDEGLTWEAKADDDDERTRPEGEEPGRLQGRTVQKGASALANQIGGYLLLGARWNKKERRWDLPGVIVPEPEAKTWISNVLGNLRPVPRHDVATWRLEGDVDRWVAVVRVDPVDEPPCMTALGHVYERVSGKSVRVTEPELLDRLIRRGRGRRAEAEAFATAAASAVLEMPGWEPTWSVRIAVALGPVGRETDDISSRLFVPSFRDALVNGLSRLVPDGAQPTDLRVVTRQQSLTAAAFLSSPGGSDWSAWSLGAHWTGAVVASATFNARTITNVSVIEQVVLPGWREVVPLVERLGGYGPAHLTLLVKRASEPKENVGGAFVAVESQPQPPPPGTLFAQLPEGEPTRVARWVGVEQSSPAVLGSMHRELQRAAGIGSLEPEDEQPKPAPGASPAVDGGDHS